jgi:hypothetical protein
MHLGEKADWTNIGELVTPIDDMAAYEAAKGKKKVSKSRFR